MRRRLSHRQVWTGPVAMALASAIGLLAALLGDGPWDTLSWLSLAVPAAVSLWVLGKTGGRRSSPPRPRAHPGR